jgi:heptosyltransferase I
VNHPLPYSRSPAALCLVRLSAIGDVCHIVPVVASIRRRWPETAITWCVGRGEHALLEGLPGVEFAVLDKAAGWRGYRRLWEATGGRRYDVLVLAQLSLRANLASAGIRADVRLGFDRVRSRELHGLFVNARIPPAPRQHVLDGFFSFAETLGVPRQELVWDIPVPAADAAQAAELLGAEGPVLVVAPCGSNPLRNWLPERYAAAADHAAGQHGFRIVLTGGRADSDATMAAGIRRHLRAPALDLTGRTSLKQLLAVMRLATVVLSPDSGPAHLGTAAGATVIALHATSNPERTGPYLSRRWCVNRYDEAARQYLGRPAAELPWGTRVLRPGAMALISVRDVTAKLDEFVAAGLPRPDPALVT